MSIISLPTSTTSDTNSSDREIYKAQDEESYNEKNIISNDSIFSQFTLTESEKLIITLSDVKLKEMLTKLNVAKVHITPLVDLILQVASSCSEVEFKEKIKTNESVCSITKQQYIRAFTAAQILRDVNSELLQYQRPNSAIYSMNTKNSFIVNSAIDDLLNGTDLVNSDTIYIDRDTMSQLLELHELVTETINKIKKAERIKKEASPKHSPETASLQVQSMDSSKAKISQENQFLPKKKPDEIEKVSVPQKSGCCFQSFEGNILNKCICNKPQITKNQEQINININANNANRNTARDQSCCQQFLKRESNCICHKDKISNEQKTQVKPVEMVPQNGDTPYQNKNIAPEKPIESPKPEIIVRPKPEKESLKHKKDKSKSEKKSRKHSRNISANKIAESTFKEPIDSPSVLNTEMLPNDKQLTVIPSNTVLRNFATVSSHKARKSSLKKSSLTTKSNEDQNKNLERNLTNDEINTTTRSYKKDKKSKKETLSESKLKKTSKLSKKQKMKDNNENDKEEKSDVTTNKKKKSKQSLESRSNENNNDNRNLDFKQKNRNLSSEEPEKLNKLNNKATEKNYKNTNQDTLSKQDEEISKNAIKPGKKAPEPNKKLLKKKLEPAVKLEDKKSNKKLKENDGNILTVIEQPIDSVINEEDLLKPENNFKKHKDSIKTVKYEEKLMKSNKKDKKDKKAGKENMEHSKKEEIPKNINDNSIYASAHSINQPNATVMQAPSIHIHNNDLATNKQSFSKPSDTNNQKITSNPMILNTPVKKETEITLGSFRNTLMQNERNNNNNNNVPNVNDTSTADLERNNKSISQVLATTDRVDEEATLKKSPEMSRNTQISNDIEIKSPIESRNKVVVIRDTECRDRNEIEKSETNQSFLQRTKTMSRELFSTILKEVAPKFQDRQVNKKIASARNDNYDNVADAKLALLQCFNELKKIRSYIKECDDAELRTLEQNINVKILKHDKNCGMDDAPHVHCNLQGIELTLKSDKELYASNCNDGIVNKKDAASSAQQLFIGTKINSNNNIILHGNVSNPNGIQTQTSTSDTNYKSFSIEAQTDDSAFFSLPGGTSAMSEPSEKMDEFYDMFNPKFASSSNNLNADPKQDKNNAIKNLTKSIEHKEDSNAGIPYVVGIKSLPKMEDSVNTTESIVISADSMKKIMVTEEIFHFNDSVNRALNSININNLLLSCTPVVCSRKTSLNDRRDMPELPLKPSLLSLPLSATDLVVIRQNIERKSKLHKQ